MSCHKYIRKTTVYPDGSTVDQWFDISGPNVVLLAEPPADAEQCLPTQYVQSIVCATETANVDAATGDAVDPTAVLKNVKCLLPITPKCDGTNELGTQMLIGPDGTDISATHAVVNCPIISSFTTEFCGAAGEKREAAPVITP